MLACVFYTSISHAGDAKDSESPYYLDGYDLVSYHRDSGPLLGRTEYSLELSSRTYLFANSQNLQDFKLDPDSYMPAYDGYCAYGMVYGMKSKVDPMEYDIVEGILYLQLDSGTKRRWNRKVGRYIKKSNRAWKRLLAATE